MATADTTELHYRTIDVARCVFCDEREDRDVARGGDWDVTGGGLGGMYGDIYLAEYPAKCPDCLSIWGSIPQDAKIPCDRDDYFCSSDFHYRRSDTARQCYYRSSWEFGSLQIREAE